VSYALFAALPFVGHLNPLLRQAEELQRRGWRVAIAAASEMAPHVRGEAPAIPFVDLGALGPLAGDLRRAEAGASADPNYSRGGLRFMPVLMRIWPGMFDALVAAIRGDRPDVVVADIFSSAAWCAAEAAGVPCVLNNPSLLTGVPLELLPPAPDVPFMVSGRSIRDVGWWQRVTEPLVRRALLLGVAATVWRPLHRLRAARGLPRAGARDLFRGRTILVNGAFGLEYARPLPPQVHMVGPMLSAEVPPLPPDLAAWLAAGAPVVYANLGTVAMASDAQLASMAGALASDRRRALWVLKPHQAQRLPSPLPPQVRVQPWVASPRAILAHPNVRAFVSHCGINSVYESLAAGTPIVGIPMMADQRDMAVRVSDAGVGVWLDKTRVTARALRAAIDRVIDDPRYRAAVSTVNEALARTGGIRRAADLIAAAASAHRVERGEPEQLV
jgi:UDP:flavonoid glycosyltransferase YjiC (YdhE family)